VTFHCEKISVVQWKELHEIFIGLKKDHPPLFG
jgi:hypothetical protein